MRGENPPLVAFTGGGTGGHIYPGLAVAEELRGAGLRLLWIGNAAGMDRGIVERAGIEFIGIPSGKFRRDLSLKNLADAFKVLSGYRAARAALKDRAPSLLFSKGGFVSVPPCFAAKSLGIPVFAHESDATPGLATRLCSKAAERIFVAYDSTMARFPERDRAKLERSGNPVRKAIFSGDAQRGRDFLGFGADKPLVLFLGGSQGARQVNELAAACRAELEAGCYIAHQTGEANAGGTAESSPSYRAFPYLHGELPDVLAAADIVVGRSGAGTIWESACLGKPMVLIPLAGASTRGDQVINAELFASMGAAVSLPGAEATREKLSETLMALLRDRGKRVIMGKAALAIAGEPAAPAIAQRILERMGLRGDMNPVDIGALVAMAVFGIGCAFRGFIEEVMTMAAWILAGLAAFLFWRPVSALLLPLIPTPYLPQFIAVLGIFLLVFFLVKIIERAMKDTLSALNLGFLDRILGFALGLVEGFIVSAIIVALIVYQPVWNPARLLSGSVFYSLVDSFISAGKALGHV